jgi:prolyl oligopeptidase
MRTARTGAILLLLAGCARLMTPAGAPPLRQFDGVPAYPPTPTVAAVDDYHGTRVADPYRWLERLDDPAVRRWAAAQTAITRAWLGRDSTRAALLARMTVLGAPYEALEAAAPAVARAESVAVRLTTLPGGTHRVLARMAPGQAPAVLVDPRAFGPATSIARVTPAPGGALVAYELSDAGSEWVETRLHRVADGRDLPETLTGLLWSAPVWTRDGRGFLYVHHERMPAGAHVMYHDPSVRYHVAGTPQAEDRVIFRTRPGTTDLVLTVALLADGRHVLVSEGTGADWAGIGQVQSRLHLLDLRDARVPDLGGAPRPLTPDRDHAYRVVAQRDSLVYLFTDRGAPRRRVVAVNLRDPDPARWRTMIPESTDVLDRVHEIEGRLVAVLLRDVQHRVHVHDLDGRLVREIALPPFSTVSEVRRGARASEVDIVSSGLLRAPAVVRHDVVRGTDTVLQPPAALIDTGRLEARQVWYRAKDGTRIPMFLVHRRDLARDGTHPTILFGYGASGTVIGPTYTEHVLAWVERGGVYAVPALRGGGEFGRAWYDAAILGRKQTSFDDFISAAEWLVAERYASPATLGIQGASNGGLLVAAVLTQRPELFGAAVAEVPQVDVLRYDRGRHRPQFGSAADPAQFPFLYAYAPLQRVRHGTCYPATLLTTAMNDERAPAWHALKFTAALQAAQGCARPVLLRADTTGGHGALGAPDAWLQEQADALAFMARALGLPR